MKLDMEFGSNFALESALGGSLTEGELRGAVIFPAVSMYHWMDNTADASSRLWLAVSLGANRTPKFHIRVSEHADARKRTQKGIALRKNQESGQETTTYS